MSIFDELKGLRPGVWDITVDRLISEGSSIHGHKNELIRVELIKNTTWDELLKALPKGSIIKSFSRVR